MKWYDIHDRQTLTDVMPAPVKKALKVCFGSERKFYDNKLYTERVEVLKTLDGLLRYSMTPEEVDRLNAAGALAETVEETTIREAVLAAEDEAARRRKGWEHWHEVLSARKDEPAAPKKGRKK